MVTTTYFVLLPCLNSKALKTHSIKRIESLLREGLATIEEDPEVLTPSPRPETDEAEQTGAQASGTGKTHSSTALLEKKVSFQKRKTSAKLRKGPQGGWQVKISRFSTVIGDSYVRFMNGLVEMGNLGEIAFSAGSSYSDIDAADNSHLQSAVDDRVLLKSAGYS